MTNQIQGETLFKGWAGAGTDDWVYTPWLTVRGDVATFAIEVTAVSGVTVTWNVETRTRESTTVENVFNSNQTISATGIDPATNDGASDVPAKELVRYKYATGSGASTTDFVTLRALQPAWQADR